MNFLGKIFVAILLVPLFFLALWLSVFNYAWMSVTIEQISKRCRCPSISSDEEFKTFALQKILSHSSDVMKIYRRNIELDASYIPHSSPSSRKWTHFYWSYTRSVTFYFEDPPGPGLFRDPWSYLFSVNSDECGRVMSVVGFITPNRRSVL